MSQHSYSKKPIASSHSPLAKATLQMRPFQSSLHDSRIQTQTEEQPDLQRELAIAQRTTPNWAQMQVGGTPSVVQTKLTVGAPGDQYEQEADRVADRVMSMPDSAIQRPVQRETMPEEVQTKPLAVGIAPLVQRETMPEEEEVQTKAIASVQRKEMPEEEKVQTKSLDSIQREEMLEEKEVQTKPDLQRSGDGSLQASSLIESQLNSSKGGGSPLPDEVRSFMEPRFGADFSQVRVHNDSAAVQMNRDLNAQAFTHQQDVYFGAGKAPGRDALTAHELTHVVQQMPINTDLVNRLPNIQLDETSLQRVTRLDREIARGLKGDWEMAAKALNQYSVEDIQKTLENFQGKRITPTQRRGIHQGAISAGLGPHSNAAKETSLVPGLSKDRVADIESKWLSNDRGATVQEAALVLSEAGKMDLTKMGGDRNNIRGIAYDENASSDTKTVKSYGITAGFKNSIINIYPIAFEKDLSWLFATILHEYQHVLQYTSSTEAIVRGTEEEKSNQQEVEAWASMLINAKETGIISSPSNIRECWQGLISYWSLLGAETKAPLETLYKNAKSVAREVLGSSKVK